MNIAVKGLSRVAVYARPYVLRNFMPSITFDFPNIVRSCMESLVDSGNKLLVQPAVSYTNVEDKNDTSFIWFSSTMKKRRIKMNKHKRRKARKLKRKNTKDSRKL